MEQSGLFRLRFDFKTIPEDVLSMREGPHTRVGPLYVRAGVAKGRCAAVLIKHLLPSEPTNVKKACCEIIKILPGNGDAAPKGESAERTMVYHVLLDAAEQIPYYHPSQTKLARLISALRGTPKTGTVENLAGNWPKTNGPRYRFDFAGLVDVLDSRHEPPHREGDLDGPAKLERARRWINVHAFYANICFFWWSESSAYLGSVMIDAFGVSPLEVDASYRLSASDAEAAARWQDVHISAAAQWIIYSGQNIFREVMNPSETLESYQRPLRIPLAEWRRWKDGFTDFSHDSERQDEARALARRAANLMEALEENMMPGQGGAQVEGGPSTEILSIGSSAGMPDQPNRSQ